MVLMWTWGMGEEVGGWSGPGLVGGHPQSHPLPTHLSVGLGKQFNDTGMWCGHHTVSVDLDDSVSHANAPTLSDATPEETADLTGQEGATILRRPCLGLPTPNTVLRAGASQCRPPRRIPAARGRGAGG